MWKWFCSLNPNYPDYLRNSAWSIVSSIIVTLGLKFETWGPLEMSFLFGSLICFIIVAKYLTVLGNFIKKYQSKYSDLKLISRSKNDFSEIGKNYFNEIHVNNQSKETTDYPSFLSFDNYVYNASFTQKEKKEKYPKKLGKALLFTILGFVFVFLSGFFSRKGGKTDIDTNKSEVICNEKIVAQKIDSLTMLIAKYDSINHIRLESLRNEIDATIINNLCK